MPHFEHIKVYLFCEHDAITVVRKYLFIKCVLIKVVISLMRPQGSCDTASVVLSHYKLIMWNYKLIPFEKYNISFRFFSV
jgi:hypothetical protein